MRSSSGIAIALAALTVGSASRAEAQQAQGFGVERLYTSAPGGGWVVMDALDMRGDLGGGAALSLGYAHNPLKVASSDGAQHLTVVSTQAFASAGFAATYDRFRAYVAFTAPLLVHGDSGNVGTYELAGPSVDPGTNPDLLSDARIGFDARVLGDAKGAFRLGAGAQLFVPSGNRSDYHTDGSYRAMGRVLFAGDIGMLAYAGHVGVHLRPLDDSPTPGSPQGSELLFGIAGGARFAVGDERAFVIGPEVFGASAFRSLFGTTSTALEGLLSGRLEGTGEDGPQLRLKLGTGGGIHQHFGAPEWRLVFAIEVFDHNGRSPRGR